MKAKGYAIGAQTGPKGMGTTGGGSAQHRRMKPRILSGMPKDSGHTVNNKNMYKSKKAGKSGY